MRALTTKKQHSKCQDQPKDVQHIYSTNNAFAALKVDGHWRNPVDPIRVCTLRTALDKALEQ